MNESRGTSVNPVTLARASGFSHGVLYPPQAGALLFVAGQIGWDRNGQFTTDDFTLQFEQALLGAPVVEVVLPHRLAERTLRELARLPQVHRLAQG